MLLFGEKKVWKNVLQTFLKCTKHWQTRWKELKIYPFFEIISAHLSMIFFESFCHLIVIFSVTDESDMYKSFFTKKNPFFKNCELRNYRCPSVDNIFQIILIFNSDFLGYRQIRHVQQIFHEKNLFFKNRELRNYLRPSVDNIFQNILIFNGDFFG